MPFTLLKKKHKGQRLYRSLSGRKFTQKQVRRYYARGGTFDAKQCNCGATHGEGFFCDAATVNRSDPTGTLSLRRAFARELDRRWRMVKMAVNAAIRDQDVFAFSPASIMNAQVISTEGGRLKAFQTWFDAILGMYVYGADRGAWTYPFIEQAYKRGVNRASRLTNSASQISTQGREQLLVGAATSEIQGVMEAVSQQAVRNINAVLISGSTPREAARLINDIIDNVGNARGRAIISVAIVHAHATGTLDTFETVGVSRVGLEPEHHKQSRAIDALTHDAPRRKRKPTSRQQGLFERRERKLGKLNMVAVETAGDDKVCPVCEEIAGEGPYSIDAARGLIPAHPSCRCAFVPAEENIEDDWREADHPRHPAGSSRGGEFSSAGHAMEPASEEKAKERTSQLEKIITGTLGAPDVKEQEAIEAYKANAYRKWNKVLRENSEELDGDAAAFQNLIERSLFKDDAVLYRGMNSRNLTPDMFEKVKGKMVELDGFTSTTRKKSTAENFLNEHREFGKDTIIMEIQARRGQTGMEMKGSTESEVVLPHGSRFQILSVERNALKTELGSTTIVKARYAGHKIRKSK